MHHTQRQHTQRHYTQRHHKQRDDTPQDATHRPLTVAHVTGETGFSGGEVQVFLLMEGLRKRGHRNVLLCPGGSRSEGEARRRGLEVHAIRTRNEWSPRNVSIIRRRLAACVPDLVHLHTGRANWLGGLAAWRLGLPALTTRRMDRPVKRNLRTRFIYGRAVQRAVAISPTVHAQLVASGVPRSITRLVPSAVDPDAIFPRRGRDATRRRLGLGADATCLLSVASLVRRKGVDVLIGALARLGRDGLRPLLCVAGEGAERSALERQAIAAGLEEGVRFLGERDDVPDLLAACDVFVLPSRREGLGVAALEAMALGRPVVATRVGGLGTAVVHGRTGLLVAPDDAAELAAALATLIRDPVLRERLGRDGPLRVDEGFRADQMVEAYERIYREVIDEVGGR